MEMSIEIAPDHRRVDQLQRQVVTLSGNWEGVVSQVVV